MSGPLSVSGNSVTAGARGIGVQNGQAGSAFGSGIFIQGNNGITFSLGSGQTATVSDVITDQTGSGGTGGNAGAGSLTKSGAGTLTLGGNNGYTGGTAINGGIVSVSADNNLGNAAGALAFGGGTLQLGASFNLSSTRTITLNAGGGSIDTNGFSTTISQAIGGTGALSKTGTGTLTLGGNNGYAGGTTVSAGTLAIGNSSALGTGTVLLGGGTTLQAAANGLSVGNAISLGGSATIDTQSNGLTLTNAILGGGSLTKIGTGTLTLDNANAAYTGATTVAAGTLALLNGADMSNTSLMTVNGGATFDISGHTGSAAINALAGGGTVQLGGNGLVILNASTEFSGAVAGSGGLEILSGTQTLSGVNGYTNATQIDPGATLALKGNGSIASSAFVGFAGAGATLDISQTNSGTSVAGLFSLGGDGIVSLGSKTLTVTNGSSFAGVIQDGGIAGGTGGSLVIAGNASQDLRGVNTYTGSTTIMAGGTLSLSSLGSIASSSGVNLAGSGASFDISGSSGNQTIKDLSGVAGSTIQLGANSLTVGTANSASFAGSIDGNGGLVKAGTGTLTLAGINTYTGPTTVNGGTLSVNGSIASSSGLTVNAGGSIGGNGLLPSITINGGTLAPGNSIGTLTIQGNLVLTAAAAYIVEVSPTQADRTNVTGTATLAGTVQAVFGPGSYIARTYTILSAAGGRSGTFGSLTTSGLPAGFAAALSYTGTDAILNLTAVLGQQPTTPGQQPLPNGALSGNQFNVANSLNNFFNTGGTLPPGFVTIFGLTGANLGNALTQLSGEAATGAQQAGFQMGSQFLNLMLDPFVDGRSGVAGTSGPALGFAPERDAALPSDIALAYSSVLKAPAMQTQTYEPRWTAWGGAYGGSNKTSGDPAVLGSHDLAARTAGFAGGLDYRLSSNSVVGLALAGGGTNWSLANGLGGGKSDAFQAGVYGATKYGPAYLAAAFAFTNHWMSTDRFAFAGDHLTASFNAQSYGGRIESGYRFATWYGGMTPYAAIQAQSFRTPGYSETDANGGGFGLSYNSRTGTDTRSELGTRFDRVLALYTNAVLSLRARVAWAHDWVSDPMLAPVFQALPGASFIVNGAAPAKNSALASAGTELRLANGIALLAKFDGEFASHSSTYAGTGTVRYTW